MSILSRVMKLNNAISQTVEENLTDPNSELWSFFEGIARAFAYNTSLSVVTKVNNAFKQNQSNLSIRSNQVERDPIYGNEKIKSIRKSNKPYVGEYVIQYHNADKAGPHWDFRIEIDGEGHSWVIKRMKMPPLRDRPLKAIQQPTHAVEYFDFEGVIEEGYGKGTVDIIERGQMEILHSDNDNVDFVIYQGKNAGRYKLKRWYYTEDGKSHVHGEGDEIYGEPSNEWLLIQKKDGPKYPPHYDRPTDNYKSVKQEFNLDEYIVTEKLDGTHSVLHINTKAYHRNVLASRRPPALSNTSHKARGGILHQEDNLPWIRDMEIACITKILGHVDVTNIFRALGFTYQDIREISYEIADNNIVKLIIEFEDFDKCVFHVEVHHELGHSYTSGLMNSNPLKAREMQAKNGKAKVTLIDVREYQGEDVRHVHYRQRMNMMKRFAKYHPEVSLPAEPKPGQSHREFHEEIIKRKGEGTIAIHKEQVYGGKSFKIKGHMDYDFRGVYYIVGFTEGEGKYSGNAVGAIYYSNKPNGEPLGKAAGMDDNLRKDMYEHPEEYIGKKVTIESKHHIEKGKAVRAPNVVEVEKGVEPGIED